MADPTQRRKLSDSGTGVYDLVVVRNTGKKPLTLRHKNMGDVELQPGKQRTIPVGIALVNLGNPGARDNGRRNDRTREIQRVQRKWGFNRGFFSESAWFEKGKDNLTGEDVGPFCPTIEAYSLDGERMFFVHDDPLGVKNTRDLSRLEDAASDDRFVRMEMDELKQQLTRLQDLVQSKEEGDSDGADFVAPVDIPQAALDALGITQEQMSQALAVAAGVSDEPETSVDTTADSSTVAVEDESQSQAERNEQREQLPQPPDDEKPLAKDKPATPRIGGSGSKSK